MTYIIDMSMIMFQMSLVKMVELRICNMHSFQTSFDNQAKNMEG